MIRKTIVLVVAILALGLMAWSGLYNYQRRKQQAAALHTSQAMLVPDGHGPPQPDAGSTEGDQPSPLQGKPAPPFTLEDLDGHKVSLADYQGKAVLVNFWATWCAPCKIEIPWLIKLRDQYMAQGFEVLGIESDNFDTDSKALAEYKTGVAKTASGFHINYPVLLEGDTISKAYGGLDGLPTSFYLDRKGVVVAQVVGLASRDEIEANIKKALASGGS